MIVSAKCRRYFWEFKFQDDLDFTAVAIIFGLMKGEKGTIRRRIESKSQSRIPTNGINMFIRYSTEFDPFVFYPSKAKRTTQFELQNFPRTAQLYPFMISMPQP